MTDTPKMTFTVSSSRVDAHGSQADCKDARITLDTDLAGRRDAFNPAELLLAALSACMIKGIERVTPILKFELRGVEVRIHGVRQDVPPKMESIRYEIVVDTEESDQRLDLLHENVKRYGTVFNTVAPGTDLSGVMRRKSAPAAGDTL
ncbi:MAG: OsmC family protein [Polaromonas sp.]|nr:OsmC family protein [Polaromonas sp.]